MDWPGLGILAERGTELWLRTGEHLVLTGVSTGGAVVLGVPLGIVAARVRTLRQPLMGLIGVFQTIPSLAMLAILLALTGRIGFLPAIIALLLYALLPIVRNTLAGIEGVAPEVLDAARGIGMTDAQRLRMVELPLALPVIVAGIRTAAVVGVGIATLSAFIGAGGLGQFINRGLALSNTPLILLGAIPAAILALLVDGAVGAAEWGTRPLRQSERGTLKAALRPVAVASPVLLVALTLAAYLSVPSSLASARNTESTPGTVHIGAKNFTEQFILGELMARLIEERTSLDVRRHPNLGGTMICHGALQNGEIDLYPEYTGTGLTAVLGLGAVSDAARALELVREEYSRRFQVEWLEPFGFNNTYAITVRADDAEANGWRTIADLRSRAETLAAGFTAEFSERPDGYPGLRERYGFRFGSVKDLDPALMYEAIANGEVDVICAFATDGRIATHNLVPLADDLGFFPPYQAAPVVRQDALRAFPELRRALAPLAGLLDDETMQRLNFQVDDEKSGPRAVAEAFLRERGLLEED